MALKTEFQEFITLASGVVRGCIILGDSVGDANYASRFIGSALERSFVSSRCRVWVCWVNTRRVARDTVGRVGAV